MSEQNKQTPLEQSDCSTLTELSSEESTPETHRHYSSASLFGLPGSLDNSVALPGASESRPSPLKKKLSIIEPTSPRLKREELRRDAERISLTRRRLIRNSDLKKQELEKMLFEAHSDLDKLIQYIFLVVEENNSLKDILKGAVIVSDDGTLGDYSEMLLNKDKELPILTSLNHRSRLSFDNSPLLSSSPIYQEPSDDHSSQPHSVVSPSSEQIFQMSTEFESGSPVSRGRSLSDSSLKEHKLFGVIHSDQHSLYTSSLPQATVAENHLQAIGNQSNLDREDAVRKFNASLSIRKLQSLTLQESERENRHSSESALHSGGSSRKTRKNKSSIKKEAEVENVLTKVEDSEGVEDLTGGDAPLLKKPKFFTSDMLCVITERNELKEEVLRLEEKITQLKKEAARNAEWQGEEADQTGLVDRRASFFKRNTKIKNRVSVPESERFISDVLVIGYKKKEKAYVYVIHTTWSDGQRFEIYRRYGEFFTYHHRLMSVFPAEADNWKSVERKLPNLPTIDNVLSLFGRTNNESVVKQRLGTINEYCQTLLRELDTTISKSEFVISFFRPQPGDRQLQKLIRPRSNSDGDTSLILSFYPQQIPAGSTFEEYTAVADYEPASEGTIPVRAGEVVKVISREATGWWSVCRTKEDGKEEVGYVPGDFLKRYDLAQSGDENSVEVRKKYLGFVSSVAMTDSVVAEVDSAMRYVALEDYQSEDPRQLAFSEGAVLIVVEKSEDGWWLVAMNGKQGWAPASYLEPVDRRAYPEGENLVVSMRAPTAAAGGEKYVTKAAFKGECEEDISFPERATIEVIEKSISGWWMVRYKGKIGMAPASMLALTETQLNVPKEYKFAMTVDLGHGVSGIIQPPPRSKKFLLQSQSQYRQRSNTNTDEREFEAILEDGEHLSSSSSDSGDDRVSHQKRHSSMKRHVRKHVITNESRKKKRYKFKAFVRTDNIKQKQSKMSAKTERRGTAPASFLKSSWRPKKLHLEGMEAFIGETQGTDNGLAGLDEDTKRATLPSLSRAKSREEQLLLSLPYEGINVSAVNQESESEEESDSSLEGGDSEEVVIGDEPPESQLKKQDSQLMAIPSIIVVEEEVSVTKGEASSSSKGKDKETINEQVEDSTTAEEPLVQSAVNEPVSESEYRLSQIIEKTVDL